MDKQEINIATSEHSIWKIKLGKLVETGVMNDELVEHLNANECNFGKWLHNPSFPHEHKSSLHYKQVNKLHDDFHRIASLVIELVLKGNRQEAERLMGIGGEFSLASNLLTEAMRSWRDSL